MNFPNYQAKIQQLTESLQMARRQEFEYQQRQATTVQGKFLFHP